ncbi:hypothetical protein MHYP_G00133240 [Metynnis hypsauchen]
MTDISLSSEIIQPSAVFMEPGKTVSLSCAHTYKDYFYLYWYQQTTKDTSLKLTGYLYTTKFYSEKDFEMRFHISGDAKTEGTLQISNLSSADSAVYYCAVRDAQCHSFPLSSAKTLIS